MLTKVGPTFYVFVLFLGHRFMPQTLRLLSKISQTRLLRHCARRPASDPDVRPSPRDQMAAHLLQQLRQLLDTLHDPSVAQLAQFIHTCPRIHAGYAGWLRNAKTREALRYHGFSEQRGPPGTCTWCRGPDLNRQANEGGGFSSHCFFRSRPGACLAVRALDYAFAVACTRSPHARP